MAPSKSKDAKVPAAVVGRILGAKQLRDRYVELGAGAQGAQDPNKDPKDLLIPECVECPHPNCMLPVWPQQAPIATKATFDRWAQGGYTQQAQGGKQGKGPKNAIKLLAASNMLTEKKGPAATPAPEAVKKPTKLNEFGEPDLEALFAEAAEDPDKPTQSAEDADDDGLKAEISEDENEDEDDDDASSTDTIGEFERKIEKLENQKDKLEERNRKLEEKNEELFDEVQECKKQARQDADRIDFLSESEQRWRDKFQEARQVAERAERVISQCRSQCAEAEGYLLRTYEKVGVLNTTIAKIQLRRDQCFAELEQQLGGRHKQTFQWFLWQTWRRWARAQRVAKDIAELKAEHQKAIEKKIDEINEKKLEIEDLKEEIQRQHEARKQQGLKSLARTLGGNVPSSTTSTWCLGKNRKTQVGQKGDWAEQKKLQNARAKALQEIAEYDANEKPARKSGRKSGGKVRGSRKSRKSDYESGAKGKGKGKGGKGFKGKGKVKGKGKGKARGSGRKVGFRDDGDAAGEGGEITGEGGVAGKGATGQREEGEWSEEEWKKWEEEVQWGGGGWEAGQWEEGWAAGDGWEGWQGEEWSEEEWKKWEEEEWAAWSEEEWKKWEEEEWAAWSEEEWKKWEEDQEWTDDEDEEDEEDEGEDVEGAGQRVSVDVTISWLAIRTFRAWQGILSTLVAENEYEKIYEETKDSVNIINNLRDQNEVLTVDLRDTKDKYTEKCSEASQLSLDLFETKDEYVKLEKHAIQKEKELVQKCIDDVVMKERSVRTELAATFDEQLACSEAKWQSMKETLEHQVFSLKKEVARSFGGGGGGSRGDSRGSTAGSNRGTGGSNRVVPRGKGVLCVGCMSQLVHRDVIPIAPKEAPFVKPEEMHVARKQFFHKEFGGSLDEQDPLHKASWQRGWDPYGVTPKSLPPLQKSATEFFGDNKRKSFASQARLGRRDAFAELPPNFLPPHIRHLQGNIGQEGPDDMKLPPIQRADEFHVKPSVERPVRPLWK